MTSHHPLISCWIQAFWLILITIGLQTQRLDRF